jgi:hypothetical protein
MNDSFTYGKETQGKGSPMSELQYLQNLADMLDMYVGIETRKSVLEGNERLTLATDDLVWKQYLSQVASRVEIIPDVEKRDRILSDITYHIANQQVTPSKPNIL